MGAGGLEFAHSAGLPSRTIVHRDFANREDFDAEISKQLREDKTDIVVLAGFMRILSAQFVQQWQGRIVNIHPSLLPLYPGLDTHARALNAGDKQAGASVHFVTPELDAGPVILQGRVDIVTAESPASLAARVLEVEHVIYPLALQWLVEDRVKLCASKCAIDGKLHEQPAIWYKGQLQFADAVRI